MLRASALLAATYALKVPGSTFHAWGKSPDAVASCTITHDVDFVGIDLEMGIGIVDEVAVHCVGGWFEVHVPILVSRIGGGRQGIGGGL